MWNLVRTAAILAFLGSPAQAGHAPAPLQAAGSCGESGQGPCQGNQPAAGAPAPAAFDHPPLSGRSAYITQIGDANVAMIDQSAPIAFAQIGQDGDRNQANVRQQGPTLAYADLSQIGSANSASVTQSGVAGGNVVYLQQRGAGNAAAVQQGARAGLENGAVVAQFGNGNAVALVQDGDDNQAALTQTGDGNVMTASQLGSGNRLDWAQRGNNLSSLAIAQSGGQTMQVIQTK